VQTCALPICGFSANPNMRKQYIPFAEHHVSLVPEGNTGDGLQQARDAGGRFDGENLSNAGWVVVSLLRKPDGGIRKFPHLYMDRGKPGCIRSTGTVGVSVTRRRPTWWSPCTAPALCRRTLYASARSSRNTAWAWCARAALGCKG